MSITKQMLKTRSGEFDIESIHSMILREFDLSNLGCIGECSALERLDLSRNDISKLLALSSLQNLTYLNLSSNRITSLEGLQSLENLKTLNLAGNLIGSLDALRPLAQLEKLEELRLRDTVHDLANPICMNNSYKEGVMSILPKLRILDGERLNGKGRELFAMCKEIDHLLHLHGGDSLDSDASGNQSGPWTNDTYWENTAVKEFEGSSIGDAQQQLEALLADCHRISKEADEKLKSAMP